MWRWQKTESGWKQTEAPVPEQKKPEPAAPAPAVPTAVQLERTEAAAPNLAVPTTTTTPARGAPPEPPLMPPTEEQTAKRAALLKMLAAPGLPKHLRLGVTLPGMRELLSQLPSDAVEQINAKIPLDKKTGKPKFPKNNLSPRTA